MTTVATVSYLRPGATARVRELLVRSGLTMPAAARELGIGEDELESYAAGGPVPPIAILALERLVDLARMVV